MYICFEKEFHYLSDLHSVTKHKQLAYLNTDIIHDEYFFTCFRMKEFLNQFSLLRDL